MKRASPPDGASACPRDGPRRRTGQASFAAGAGWPPGGCEGHAGHAPDRRRWLITVAGSALASCALPGPADEAPADAPALRREFRAAWVASVAHIDWPSRAGLGTVEQRQEMHQLLDAATRIGLNAIVLQVRPACDALYDSPFEPWSEYLSGHSGRAPDPWWDPLAEWVAASHARGLELHAWFNPYRARHPSARSDLAASHVARREPGLVKAYGDLLWLDPGQPRAADRLVDVVLDVVRRYDVDGIHIDDYFYPYPVSVAGVEQAFPDEDSLAAYRAAGGALEHDAWRRNNVDRLVHRLWQAIRAERPGVMFGISPFGLPRPDRRPAGVSGFSQYHKLHADVERWLAEGWLDYLAPQLYWPLDSPGQPFVPLLQAWLALNPRARHVWPGLFTSRIGAAERAYTADEVLAQVAAARRVPPGSGHLHFSMAALLQDRDGVADRLAAGPYAQPALVPRAPGVTDAGGPTVSARVTGPTAGAQALVLRSLATPPTHADRLRLVALRRRRGQEWTTTLHPLSAAGGRVEVRLEPEVDLLLVNALDRQRRLGPTTLIRRGDAGWSRAPAG